MKPGTRLSHRHGAHTATPERWTATVLWADGAEVMLVLDCTCHITVLPREVVLRAWEERGRAASATSQNNVGR